MSMNGQQSIWDTLSSEQMCEVARAGFDPYLDLNDGSAPLCIWDDHADDYPWSEDDDGWDFCYSYIPHASYGCSEDDHHSKEKQRHRQRRKNKFRTQELKKRLLKTINFPIYSVSKRDLHKCMQVFGTERHCADNDNKIHMKRAAIEKRELTAAKKEFLLLSSQY